MWQRVQEQSKECGLSFGPAREDLKACGSHRMLHVASPVQRKGIAASGLEGSHGEDLALETGLEE